MLHLIALTVTVAATSVPSLDAQQKAVFAMEEAYWDAVNAGDRTRFLSLWHARFRGWPCDRPTTSDRKDLEAVVDDWFADVIAKGMHTTIEPAGVVVDDTFAVTYLAATTRWREGKVQRTLLQKLVHTWKRVDGDWKIIGGMCGPLERDVHP